MKRTVSSRVVLCALLISHYMVWGAITKSGMAQAGAQNASAYPGRPSAPVLTYAPARKGHPAHVVFTPPARDFTTHKNVRLQTPQGEVVVHCEPFHPGNPSRTWASEISYPLDESLYYLRSPPALPIYFFHPFAGNAVGGGSRPHEVRVNGKTLYGGAKSNLTGPDGPPVYGTFQDGLNRTAPIVLVGKWNKIALIISDSGGD